GRDGRCAPASAQGIDRVRPLSQRRFAADATPGRDPFPGQAAPADTSSAASRSRYRADGVEIGIGTEPAALRVGENRLIIELGLLMMVYLDLVWRWRREDGRIETCGDLTEAIAAGAGERIRPMLMTALTLVIAQTPIMFSTGTGADVMRRLAAPMLGGVVSALVLVLIVFPAVFSLWRGRGLPTSVADEDLA
ncbi:MAG: efflux RND transporter permease subunit, partial [Gammaproteobacteria bacterium]|nr:efflux RND transporter permease subunit [Gammaproteobacteria bacterium]